MNVSFPILYSLICSLWISQCIQNQLHVYQYHRPPTVGIRLIFGRKWWLGLLARMLTEDLPSPSYSVYQKAVANIIPKFP